MQSSKLSKSQKRKNRLIKKAVETTRARSIVSTLANANTTKPAAPKRRRNRRRSKGGLRLNPNPLSYDQALLDPERAEGAKIPDMIAYPTGTFQTVEYLAMGAGTGGNSCAFQFYPVIGDGSTVFPFAVLNGTSSGSLSVRTTAGWTERSAITSLYSLYRPVSASVEVFWIGTELNRGGEICAACTWYQSVGTPPSTFAALLNLPDMIMTDVEGGVKVLWKPLDNSHLTFQPVNGPSGTAGAPIYPQIFVGVTGIAQTGNVFNVTVTCNWEAIPDSSGANLVQTEPSPYDPSSLRKAWAWAQSNQNTVLKGLDYGLKVAGALGYDPFNRMSRGLAAVGGRPRRSSIRSAALSMMAHVSTDVSPHSMENGKDEEDIVAEAERKFDRLNITSQPSTGQTQERGIRIGGNTPISSPSLARKFSGQG